MHVFNNEDVTFGKASLLAFNYPCSKIAIVRSSEGRQDVCYAHRVSRELTKMLL